MRSRLTGARVDPRLECRIWGIWPSIAIIARIPCGNFSARSIYVHTWTSFGTFVFLFFIIAFIDITVNITNDNNFTKSFSLRCCSAECCTAWTLSAVVKISYTADDYRVIVILSAIEIDFKRPVTSAGDIVDTVINSVFNLRLNGTRKTVKPTVRKRIYKPKRRAFCLCVDRCAGVC